MPSVPIVCGSTAVDLKPAPIDPDWIRSGTPFARNALLSSSRDRTAHTMVWDCTPGEFDWHYHLDETIHILDGSVTLDDGVAPPRRLVAGDVVLFPQGVVVRWTVETHLRKLAFLHRPMTVPIALISRAVGKAKGVIRRRFSPGSAPTSAGTVAKSRTGRG